MFPLAHPQELDGRYRSLHGKVMGEDIDYFIGGSKWLKYDIIIILS